MAAIDRELETLPTAEWPVGELTPAELLRETARLGLQRLREIVSQPINPGDLKQQRLVGDMSLAVCKLFMRAAEGEFRARRGDALTALLARLQAAQANPSGN